MRFLRLRHKNVKLLFLLPAVFWTLVFTVYPLLRSLWFSFLNYRLGQSAEFVGFAQFLRAFRDYKVANSVQVIGILVVFGVCIELILGMGLALLFHQKIRGIRFFRTLLTMPLFATPVAVGFLAITIFYEEGGPINSILALFGTKIPWLSDSFWALIAILLIEIWQWTPFCFLVFLAGLQALPEEIYEAAALDCSSRWQLFSRVTLPLMQPIIITVLLLRLIEAVKAFDIPFILTKGGPGRATEVYSMFVYRAGLKFFDLGYASALAYLMLVAIMIVVVFFFKRMREIYE